MNKMMLEENLQTEQMRKIAGNMIRGYVKHLAYTAIASVGIVGSLAYSFNEANNYLTSGKEMDFLNLAVSGVCIGLAAVADRGIKVVSARLKETNKKLTDELERIKELPEYEKLQLPCRNPRICKYRQQSGRMVYCNDRDVKCAHKSDEDCCRVLPGEVCTRDYLCEPNKVHW